MSGAEKDGHNKALSVLVRLQRTLIRRLVKYVVENESSLRLAADGAEGYGYTVHQLDELFLSRLNLVERTIAELQKFPSGGASRYRTQCFVASRGEAEKEINARLEKLSEARILGVSVSPAPSAGFESDPDASDPAAAHAGTLSDLEEAPRPEVVSAQEALEGCLPEEAGQGSPGDQLLVTVLYYGPEPGAA